MSLANSDSDAFLDSVLQKLSKDGLSLDEVDRLSTLFLPSTTSHVRSKAYLVLSAFCDRLSGPEKAGGNGDEPNVVLQSILPAVEKRMLDVEEIPLLEAMSFTAALFNVHWQSASSLFSRDGFQDGVMDALDLFPSSTNVSQTVAHLLSIACGHKPCVSSLSPRCTSWLDSTFRKSSDEKLRGLVALALLKISRSPRDELSGSSSGSDTTMDRQDALYTVMRTAVVSATSGLKDISDAIEGVAYFSTIRIFKERISNDTELLKKLSSYETQFTSKASIIEHDIPGSTPFGLCMIMANLSAYKPRLSEEQANVARLRRMASAGPGGVASSNISDDDEALDDDDPVRERCKKLIEAGILDLIIAIAKTTESIAVRTTIGATLLNLVEDKGNRGKVLQAGGAKTLMLLIRCSQTQPKPPQTTQVEYTDVPSIQALAKLAITSSPLQVFGPNETAMVDAVKPLSFLLLHSSTSLLQKFEALLALTNISSASPEMAKRITTTKYMLPKLETLLLDDNTLIRRGAVELLCNLFNGCEIAFNRFSGEGVASLDTTGEGMNQTKSRLHIMVALCDVEDKATRQSASGALAILSHSPTTCRLLLNLQNENDRVLPILKQLIDPTDDEGNSQPCDPELAYRGVYCIMNLVQNILPSSRPQLVSEVEKHQIVKSLAKIIQASNPAYTEFVGTTARTLKSLMDMGAKGPDA